MLFSQKTYHTDRYYRMRGWILHNLTHVLLHLRLLIRWIFLSVLTGLIIGGVGSAFVYFIKRSTALRLSHPWLILTLPAGGILIVLLYKLLHNTHDKGTNMVLASIRSETELPVQMAPLIFISTIITHLCGGSAGREGAALQLGGSIATILGKLFRLREKDKHILILSGMSAAFSAIFRTPVAASVFAMEVGCIGAMQYAALVPCTLASLTASFVAERCGLPLSHYTVTDIPAITPFSLLKILLLGIFCSGLSILFCVLLHRTEHLLHKYIRSPYLCVAAASGMLLILGLLFRTTDYYGIGAHVIENAIAGKAVFYAFIAKMIFTAISLGGGFRGGEIVPSFFVGATFGCVFGHICGVSPSLCAAVGMIALFCGVTNCPLASLFIAAELFGMEVLPFCLLVAAVSYLLSGYYGLYREQKFLYSKFTDEPVHHKTRQ